MSAPDENPYQAPAEVAAAADDGVLPALALKQVQHVVRDARLALFAAWIPMTMLVFLLPLVRWYSLRSKFPVLIAGDAGEHAELFKRFRSAKPKLWFAVLLWPPILVGVLFFGGERQAALAVLAVFVAFVGLATLLAGSLRFRRWFQLVVGLIVAIGLMLFAPLGVYVLVNNYSHGRPFSFQLAAITAFGIWMIWLSFRGLLALARQRRAAAPPTRKSDP